MDMLHKWAMQNGEEEKMMDETVDVKHLLEMYKGGQLVWIFSVLRLLEIFE